MELVSIITNPKCENNESKEKNNDIWINCPNINVHDVSGEYRQSCDSSEL